MKPAKAAKPGMTPVPASGHVVIEVMSGPEDGREIFCQGFPVSIGRGKNNSVNLHCDHLMSRNHAEIAMSENGLILTDLGSTNGTFVGKKRVKGTVPIAPDKLFRVGATLLRIKPHPAGVPPEQGEPA